MYVLPFAHDLSSGSLDQVYEYGVLNSLGIENSIGTLSSQDFARIRQARGRIPFRNGNPTRLPAFVAFRDEKNPKTIYEVGPRNFGQSFPGVRFVGLDIEFTDAPATNVLKQRLPWLKNPNRRRTFRQRPAGSTTSRQRYPHWVQNIDIPLLWTWEPTMATRPTKNDVLTALLAFDSYSRGANAPLDVIAGGRKAATAVLANFRQLSGERDVKTDIRSWRG